MSEIITCPSGLKGSIRAMLVREERILADRKLSNRCLSQTDGGPMIRMAKVAEKFATCHRETGKNTGFQRLHAGSSVTDFVDAYARVQRAAANAWWPSPAAPGLSAAPAAPGT